eukprot:4304092-Ditylum_brightwellii.AAC.1
MSRVAQRSTYTPQDNDRPMEVGKNVLPLDIPDQHTNFPDDIQDTVELLHPPREQAAKTASQIMPAFQTSTWRLNQVWQMVQEVTESIQQQDLVLVLTIMMNK